MNLSAGNITLACFPAHQSLHMACRSVRPIMVEEFNIDWGKVFSFLFPDGNVLHGSWISYAIIAFVLAIFIELGTQLLYLAVRVSGLLPKAGVHCQSLPVLAMVPRTRCQVPCLLVSSLGSTSRQEHDSKYIVVFRVGSLSVQGEQRLWQKGRLERASSRR